METFVLKRAYVPGRPERALDLLIHRGRIERIAETIDMPEVPTLDCGGRLLLPAFVDCHTHLDKAFLETPGEVEGLMDAVRLTMAYQKNVPPDEVRSDVLRRGGKVLEKEIAAGSGLVRSHVSVDDIWGMEAFYASCELREAFAPRIEVQLSVPYVPAYADAFAEAARAGQIDYIAGYPTVTPDPAAAVDALFDLAQRFALPLDLHVDESDAADISCFRRVLERTIETGMGGRVNCSHVTALSAVPDAEAEAAAALCAKARVSVIALPSCNMFLMGRQDRGLVRRGVTRVEMLQQAGVNVAIASDNIRDPFRPFGNGDMLEEAAFACQALSRGTAQGMADTLSMATRNAALTAGKTNYGIREGADAELTLLDATSVQDAIAGRCASLLTIKRGRVTRTEMRGPVAG